MKQDFRFWHGYRLFFTRGKTNLVSVLLGSGPEGAEISTIHLWKNDYCGCTTDHLMLLLLFLFSEIQFDLISLMRTDRREVNAHHWSFPPPRHICAMGNQQKRKEKSFWFFPITKPMGGRKVILNYIHACQKVVACGFAGTWCRWAGAVRVCGGCNMTGQRQLCSEITILANFR